MKKLKIAVLDDERIAADIVSAALSSAFESYGVYLEIDKFNKARDLSRFMSEAKYDMLFLDIDMSGGGEDGFEIAEQVRQTAASENTDIVFVSNRTDKVFDSFRLSPRAFIRKSRLAEDVQKFAADYMPRQRQANDDVLVITTQYKVQAVPVPRIMYIEASYHKQIVKCVDGNTYEVHEPMYKLEEKLARYGYLRVHKGYLVNPEFIRAVGRVDVVLDDGESLPISRKNADTIKNMFFDWLGKR